MWPLAHMHCVSCFPNLTVLPLLCRNSVIPIAVRWSLLQSLVYKWQLASKYPTYNIHILGLEENFQQPDVQTNCANQTPTHSRKKASGFLTSGLFPRILDCLLSLLPEIKMSPVCPKYTRRSFLTNELEKAWGFSCPLFGDYANSENREGQPYKGRKFLIMLVKYSHSEIQFEPLQNPTEQWPVYRLLKSQMGQLPGHHGLIKY